MSNFTEAMAARSDAVLTRRKLPIPTREEVVKTRDAVDAARAQVPLEAVWIFGAIGLPMFALMNISSVMLVFYAPIVLAILKRMGK